MSAFEVGLQDAWHPVGVATLLAVIMFFVFCVRTRIAYFLTGILFFSAFWHAHTLLVIGGFDALIVAEQTLKNIRIFYLLLAVVFFGYGCLLWRIWWRVRIKEIPFVQNKETQIQRSKIKTMFRNMFLMLGAYAMGGVLVLASSVAAQDYAIFTMMMDAYSKGMVEPEKLFIPQYILGKGTLIFIFWILGSLRFSKNFSSMYTQIQPRLMMISSACFMSVSVSLIYVFLK